MNIKKLNIKKFGIASAALLISLSISGVPSSIMVNDQTLHSCNDFVRYVIEHQNQVAGEFHEIFADFPEHHSLVRKILVTREEKDVMLEKLRQSHSNLDAKELPCGKIQHKIQAIQTDFLPKFLELLATKATDPRAMPPHIRPMSKEEVNFLKAQIEVLMSMDIPFKLTLAGARSKANVLGQASLPYESLLSLVVQQIFRGLTRIDQELSLYAQAPLLNALYAQGMCHTLIQATWAFALQRWLEHDLTEQQWHELLDAQYEAFSQIVPPVCAIIAAINKK